jgi:AcrR family transcriptional regulator
MSPRPKDSTKEKALENRQKILDSAEKTFAAKGFDGANMREIAAGAGLNKYMLYYHFKDKQTLFEQVLEAIFSPLFKRFTEAIDPAPDLETAIANVYQVYSDLFTARGGRLRSFMAREIAAGAPRVQMLFRMKGPELAMHWGAKLEQHAGRKLHPEQVILIVVSIMSSIVSRFMLAPIFEPILHKNFSDKHLKSTAVAYIFGGVEYLLNQPEIESTTTKAE